jgi:type II secretory pathway pseudopilin PulG
MTLLELVIVCGILLVLASAAMPLARFTVKRQKEAELRRELREMRDAIDRYKDAADRNLIRVEAGTEGYPPDMQTLVQGVDVVAQAGAANGLGASTAASATGFGAGTTAPGANTAGSSGFGASIGGQLGGQIGGQRPAGAPAETSGAAGEAIRHVRFLRRVPVDPMTGKAEWGMRAVQDDPDSSSWGGKDVFDVFSLSTGTALDGTKYSDW